MLALPVQADNTQIAFVVHEKLPSVEQLLQKTAERLDITAELRLLNNPPPTGWQSYAAVVLVGPQALEAWSFAESPPAVAVFVSRDAVAAVSSKLASALYLEPPLKRQIALAKSILGADRPLGILMQDKSEWKNSGLSSLPLQQSLVTPYFVDQYENLNRALLDLLKNSHALIGTYDTELYSSTNIKNILITAYRQNKPLIGPSSAYIKAGALATTYSDIDDVAHRLSEMLLTGLKEHVWPDADYNPYFKVRYNQQVGRSLNLLLPDAEPLASQLTKDEREH
ncbi:MULTISPECIES: hypothetical protein [Thalassolituus]|uniref:hypothetical protein n=1 Tax=Thalassolituus TaxID=187492 RepID=UPI001E31B5A4|nr:MULTISPECIES: hypothetical protein [Thalassolituus]MCB2385390.1 hypothetical protein [Thalassolituus alkanivorans]MCB2422211.1 hypothetical protein [Thalassolituus alkanivorans]